MQVSTNFKRAICFKIKREADATTPSPLTFISLLESYADAQVSRTFKGFVVSATAGNGRNTVLHIPSDNGRDLTPAQVTELFAVLQDDYTDAQAKLIAAGNLTPTDAQIYAQMIADMRAIAGYTANFFYLAK